MTHGRKEKNEVRDQTTGREFCKVHLPGVRQDASGPRYAEAVARISISWGMILRRGTMDEKKIEKFCHEHDIDCNDCPLRDECSEYYGKYHELPERRYKGDDNG